MRFSLSVLSVACLPWLASAGQNHEETLPLLNRDVKTFGAEPGTYAGCLEGEDFFLGYTVRKTRGCSFGVLAEYLTAELPQDCPHDGTKELILLLGEGDEDVARAAAVAMCTNAWRAYLDDNEYPWDQVSGYGPIWDKEYYDGNTHWNEEHQTELDKLIQDEPANHFRREAPHIREIFEAEAQGQAFGYPSMDNFENCQLQSIMCCWVSDRQANDNNGNCATPYDENCLDADPGDNTDLCAVDMARSTSSSAHVDGGFSWFNDNSEGPVHCHGLAWGAHELDTYNRYKANNLFFVSMYDHLYQRGYVRNVPGAPMCGCVEKMPIVSRSDCTQVDDDETWVFVWNAGTKKMLARLDYVELDFNACRGEGGNNDLNRFINRLKTEGRYSEEMYTEFRKTVRGNCNGVFQELLTEKGYTYNPQAATPGWTQVYSKGLLAPYADELLKSPSTFTKQADTNLRRLQNADSPVFYIRRYCPKCTRSHREIIYKRLTAFPEGYDFIDLFTNNWVDTNNINLLDFTLHYNMEDALADANPWSFCNYNENLIGFPRDCGPSNFVGGQWNSISRGGQPDIAYYVWNKNPTVTDPARPYPSVDEFGDKQDGFCVKSGGGNQNSGVYRISSGDVNTPEKESLCLQQCAAFPGHTGCEAIFGQSNRGCYVHTQEVARGNGRDNHSCWINADTTST